MELERIVQTLTMMGFLKIDAEIYLSLALKGPQTATNLSESLEISRSQIRRSLSTLLQKGFINTEQNKPTRFSAAPIEEVLDICKKEKLENAQRIEKRKKEILLLWQSVIK